MSDTTITIPEGAAWLTTEQTALYTGMSKQWLEIARHRGVGPRYSKIGAAVRYAKSDLDEFMAASIKYSTVENGNRPKAKRARKAKPRRSVRQVIADAQVRP